MFASRRYDCILFIEEKMTATITTTTTTTTTITNHPR